MLLPGIERGRMNSTRDDGTVHAGPDRPARILHCSETARAVPIDRLAGSMHQAGFDRRVAGDVTAP